MKYSTFLLLTQLLVITSVRPEKVKSRNGKFFEEDPVLIFEDNFDTLDFSKWQHEITMNGGGNKEFEVYINNRSNSFVRDGVLYLKPTLTSDIMGTAAVEKGGTLDLWGADPGTYCTSQQDNGCFRQSNGVDIINPITSARIRTAGIFSFKYGRVEVRAKMPVGDWIWPGIWLRPIHNEYGIWPASGEIDIVESRGNLPSNPSGGYDKFGTTLHWGPYASDDPWHFTHVVRRGASDDDLINNFHTYGLIWNETYMGSYFDREDNAILSHSFDVPLWELGGWSKNKDLVNPWISRGNNAPFDKEFYLLLNVAVGGACEYWPDGNGKPWTNASPMAPKQFWDKRQTWYPTWKGDATAMQIDSVKVWGNK